MVSSLQISRRLMHGLVVNVPCGGRSHDDNNTDKEPKMDEMLYDSFEIDCFVENVQRFYWQK